MSLYREIKRELDREPDNRQGVLEVICEETTLTKDQALQLANLFWYLQEQIDDAADLCGTFRLKIRELQRAVRGF